MASTHFSKATYPYPSLTGIGSEPTTKTDARVSVSLVLILTSQIRLLWIRQKLVFTRREIFESTFINERVKPFINTPLQDPILDR